MLLNTQECLEKISNRGQHVNWQLISDIDEFLSKTSFVTEDKEDVTIDDILCDAALMRKIIVRCLSSSVVDGEERTQLANYLTALSPLRTYNISFAHVAVLLLSLRPRAICNLYRHLYLEFSQSREHFVALSQTYPLYSYAHIPSAFSRMKSEDMYDTWFAFIKEFVSLGKPYSLFFVNKLHSYMLPFE